MSAKPPPLALIPSPRVKAAIGLRSKIVPKAPVPVIGKKAPPAMPSEIARIDWATPACSAVRASLATMNISDVLAVTTAAMSTPTTSTEPKPTSKRSAPAANSTAVATTPRMKLTNALAATIIPGFIGIEHSRA